MDVEILEALLGVILDKNGGTVRISREEAESASFDGRQMVVSFDDDGIVLSLEEEESIDEFVEG